MLQVGLPGGQHRQQQQQPQAGGQPHAAVGAHTRVLVQVLNLSYEALSQPGLMDGEKVFKSSSNSSKQDGMNN